MGNKKKTKKKNLRERPAQDTIEGEIAANIAKVAEIERRQREQRTAGERLAETIAAFCGSMVFVYVHVVFFIGWIALNTVVPGVSFDPFPFTFLTLVVSLEAIFLSTFILINQNHETLLFERRNHLDLQINMLAEQENTRTLQLLQAIAQKVGVQHDDKMIDALIEPMEPEKVIKEIARAADEDIPASESFSKYS